MYKDPTEFRARFKAYKEGKMPYENGLPKFAGGTPGLTSTQQAALDDMYNYFNPLGYDIISISGMGGNGLLESGLNPDIVSKSGYAGVWQNNKNLQNAIKDMYGDHSKDNLFRYANAWVNGDQLIRKGKHAAHTALGSGKFKKAGYKTAEEAADAWLKNYERAVILDSNGKVIGYQDQGKRKAFAKAAYNYLFGKYGKGGSAVSPEPIVEQAVSTAVRNTIPAEQTIPAYDTKVSPYISGKPMIHLQPRIKLPNLLDMLDDEWEPTIGFKNGKLPKYGDGTIPYEKDGVLYNINPNVVGASELNVTTPEVVVTGTDRRPLYQRYDAENSAYNQEDVEKGFNAITLGGLNNLSPAQWLRRGYDAINGNLTIDSWLNGNAGIVPTKYAEEHPLMATAANGLLDFWILGGPSLLKNALSTEAKLNPILFAKYEPLSVQQPLVKPLIAPKQFEIEEIPGYLLRSLMRGNALEKQLSKQGTISVNSIRAHADKASEVEKSVINEVLSSKEFANLKSIDYNKFRLAVHSRLIEYNITPDYKWEDYGIRRLGYNLQKIEKYDNKFKEHAVERANKLIRYANDNYLATDPERYRRIVNIVDNYNNMAYGTQYVTKNGRPYYGVDLNTYKFSSPHISIGNDKHYDANTLGHSRTFTAPDEPDILHVMESQSDWAQAAYSKIVPEELKGSIGYFPDGSAVNLETNKHYSKEIVNLLFKQGNAQPKYLHDNYLQRQIQENLKYAAQHGHTKMRYPTPETAAKIEGYRSVRRPFKNGVELDPREFADNQNTIIYDDFVYPEDIEVRNVYRPEHRTILKKYLDFPKQFKKLHKNTEVREVTDTKGNTWYEVDVPKDFLKKEWMYGMSIPTVVGAGLSLNVNGKLPSYSNGKIYIKPANRGKLTRLKARTGKSESELYNDGNPAHKKMVVFARNARKWKH